MKKDDTSKEVDYHIGIILCNARVNSRISRKMLLDKLYEEYQILLSEETLKSYEYGRRSCSIRNFLLISQILGVDLGELRESVLNEVFRKKSK